MSEIVDTGRAVRMLREKMGPMLKSDIEAKFMLAGLLANPSVVAFLAHQGPRS